MVFDSIPNVLSYARLAQLFEINCLHSIQYSIKYINVIPMNHISLIFPWNNYLILAHLNLDNIPAS